MKNGIVHLTATCPEGDFFNLSSIEVTMGEVKRFFYDKDATERFDKADEEGNYEINGELGKISSVTYQRRAGLLEPVRWQFSKLFHMLGKPHRLELAGYIFRPERKKVVKLPPLITAWTEI